ncbi:hypothetical protein [Methylocystis parvus]|uniref:hypothetical protein n=1 Tax=Methylocystis parvus TaxID=134 RepID=UPI003C755AE1
MIEGPELNPWKIVAGEWYSDRWTTTYLRLNFSNAYCGRELEASFWNPEAEIFDGNTLIIACEGSALLRKSLRRSESLVATIPLPRVNKDEIDVLISTTSQQRASDGDIRRLGIVMSGLRIV